MSQEDAVLKYMQTGAALTPLEALQMFGTMRLSAIIYQLRLEGHNITTETNKNGKPFAIYRLVPKVLRKAVDTQGGLFPPTPWQ